VLAPTQRPWDKARLAIVVAVWIGVGFGSAGAETLRYGLAIPDRDSVTYLLDLDVRHPGELTIRAEWSGPRSLSLKLTPPDQAYGALLRSGPSPQELEAIIEAKGFEAGTWQLRIFALSGRGSGEGSLVIELPGPEPELPESVAEEVAAVEGPQPEPWMLPFRPSGAVRTDWVPFLDATERFRSELFGAAYETPLDVCQWQVPLMRYFAVRRESLLADSSLPSVTTAKFLDRLASAIETVERLRTTDDPLVIGPVPDDPALRSTWLKLRTTKIDPVEDELDQLLSMLQRGHAPDLDQEEWPLRLVSCLTACERYFEQRARVGEKRAGNRELALAQWPRVLRAGRALSTLADLTPRARASH
jgi:hypothetical protein